MKMERKDSQRKEDLEPPEQQPRNQKKKSSSYDTQNAGIVCDIETLLSGNALYFLLGPRAFSFLST